MRRKRTRKIRLADVTPLIDVVLMLVIFFAVTSTFQKTGISLTLPESQTVENNIKGIVISIDAKKNLFWNEAPITLTMLEARIKEEKRRQPDLNIILHAHADTSYQWVIHVMDEIRKGGCYSITIEAEKTKTESASLSA